MQTSISLLNKVVGHRDSPSHQHQSVRKTREACDKWRSVQWSFGNRAHTYRRLEDVMHFSFLLVGVLEGGGFRHPSTRRVRDKLWPSKVLLFREEEVCAHGFRCLSRAGLHRVALLGPQAYVSLPSWVRVFSLTFTQALGLLGILPTVDAAAAS